MKFKIEHPYLGQRSFEGNDVKAMIQTNLELLREFKRRNCSPKPALLAEDIRCYELLLAEPLAAEKCREYAYRRQEDKHLRSKKAILVEMGVWQDEEAT